MEEPGRWRRLTHLAPITLCAAGTHNGLVPLLFLLCGFDIKALTTGLEGAFRDNLGLLTLKFGWRGWRVAFVKTEGVGAALGKL